MQFESDEYHCKPNTSSNCLKARGGLEKKQGKTGVYELTTNCCSQIRILYEIHREY